MFWFWTIFVVFQVLAKYTIVKLILNFDVTSSPTAFGSALCSVSHRIQHTVGFEWGLVVIISPYTLFALGWHTLYDSVWYLSIHCFVLLCIGFSLFIIVHCSAICCIYKSKQILINNHLLPIQNSSSNGNLSFSKWYFKAVISFDDNKCTYYCTVSFDEDSSWLSC